MRLKFSAYFFLYCSIPLFGFAQQFPTGQNTIASNVNGANQLQVLSTSATLNVDEFFYMKRAARIVLGVTKNGKPVEAYYFPGQSEKRALVIGGMHGSELSSIAIARNLVTLLQTDSSNYYSVVVLPSLFPDNATVAMKNPRQIGSLNNIGRYSDNSKPDPNRQMPPLGKAFNPDSAFDFAGRPIEKENQFLLRLIQTYKPDRILNIHAIRDIRNAGVFADPRTEANGKALGFETDSSLAVAMALAIEKMGGSASGNQLKKQPTAMYHSDFRAVSAGSIQKRNFLGSSLPNQRGYGTSLGSWAATGVSDSLQPRKAIRLLTMEFPGCKRPEDYTDAKLKDWCQQEINRYTSSILSIFLNNFFEE